jgi:hypothetical protein
VASGARVPTLHWWDVSTRALVGRIDLGENVLETRVTPDGTTILALTRTRVAVLEMGAGAWGAAPVASRSIPFAEGHDADATALAVSPTGTTVATSGAHHLVDLWDLGTGRLTATLDGSAVGQPVWARSVAFSPDGRRLAAVGSGATSVWNLATARPEALLVGQTGAIARVVAWSADAVHLATIEDRSRNAGTVLLWSLP